MDARMIYSVVKRVDADSVNEMDDPVVREVPLTIYLNGSELVTLLYTPELADMLALGFLRSEGLIDNFDDVISVRLDNDQGFIFVETKGNWLAEKIYGKRTITSGCGKGSVFFSVLDSLKGKPVSSDLTITKEQILVLMSKMQKDSILFHLTGGIHSAAICAGENVLIMCEDIGRHNAVDKIVGISMKHNMVLSDKILLTSGRVSSEILVKSAKLGIPVLISRSAPTDLSINLAQALGITLIGFARGRRFNIYANAHRVIL